MNKYQRYAAHMRATGCCTHCGKECAPYKTCETRRRYIRERARIPEGELRRFRTVAKTPALDRRYWPRRNHRPDETWRPFAAAALTDDHVRELQRDLFAVLRYVEATDREDIVHDVIIDLLEGKCSVELVSSLVEKKRKRLAWRYKGVVPVEVAERARCS